MSKLKDLTGLNFGNLFVIERLPNYRQENGRTRTRWKCQCACGKEYVADGSHLLHGAIVSCGCVRNKKASERGKAKIPNGASVQVNTIDLTGKKFNKLTVIRRYGHDSSNKITWLCRCDCGNYAIVNGNNLTRSQVKSCGCVSSFGEAEVASLLTKYGVKYATQYQFQDLLSSSGNPLRFDFAILNADNSVLALIEYQGIQHSKKRTGEFGKQQREETDNLKIEYCKSQNIPLFHIWYNQNTEYEILSLMCKVKQLLHDNSVPSLSNSQEGVTTIRNGVEKQ